MYGDIERLRAVFGKLSRAETKYEVRASAKYYPKLVKVYIPNEPYSKAIPFLEPSDDDGVSVWPDRVIGADKTTIETNLERSIRKTKTLISDLVLCSPFDSFSTFTFSPDKTADRANAQQVKIQMRNWIKNQQKRNGKFKYLIVPEFHKDGMSLHFHALFSNYSGTLTDSGKKINGRASYQIDGYTLGFNSLVKIDDLDKVSNYVKKYITKEMPQFRNSKRFWSSNGLARPIEIDNPADWYKRVEPLKAYQNEYGLILYFERTEESDEGVSAS